MKGKIINYRGSYKQQRNKQVIIEVDGISDKNEAEQLINKEVVWRSATGREITGVITQLHGDKGAVRVLFLDKGLPDAIGSEVEVKAQIGIPKKEIIKDENEVKDKKDFLAPRL